MENVRLYLLKIILIAIVIFAAAVQAASFKSPSKYQKHSEVSSDHPTKISKRSTYDRSWGKSSYNTIKYNNNFPPYLVFNRKVGAYYPYYKYPSESNSIRRNTRRMGQYGNNK